MSRVQHLCDRDFWSNVRSTLGTVEVSISEAFDHNRNFCLGRVDGHLGEHLARLQAEVRDGEIRGREI